MTHAHHDNPATTENLRTFRAARWLMRLRHRDIDTEQFNEWLDWANRDERNLATFEDIRNLADGLTHLSAEQKSEMLRECLDAPATARATNRSRRRWRIGMGLAASVLIVAGILVYAGLASRHDGAFRDQYQTLAGHTRSVELPDGTFMELAAGSRATVVYRAHARTVELAAGEAYFKVQHDARRPFIVHVGDLRLEDIGTAFNVRKGSDKVVVAVAEGAVKVSADQPAGKSQRKTPPSGEVMLVAGQQLATQGATRVVTHVERGNIAEWRSGRLRFRDAPLSEVVTELDRYASRRVVLDGPEVGQLRFTGTVFIDRVDAWLAAVGRTFPVHVHTDAAGRRVISLQDRSRRSSG